MMVFFGVRSSMVVSNNFLNWSCASTKWYMPYVIKEFGLARDKHVRIVSGRMFETGGMFEGGSFGGDSLHDSLNLVR